MATFTRNESLLVGGISFGVGGAGIGIEHGLFHLPVNETTLAIDAGLGALVYFGAIAIINGLLMPREPRARTPRTTRRL